MRIVHQRERERPLRARGLRGGDEIGAAAGLRDDDEQRAAHVRPRAIRGEHRRRSGGGEQREFRFHQVAQIDADMPGAAAAAEHHNARPEGLHPVCHFCNRLAGGEQPFGGRRDFRNLARHGAFQPLNHCGLKVRQSPAANCRGAPPAIARPLRVRHLPPAVPRASHRHRHLRRIARLSPRRRP